MRLSPLVEEFVAACLAMLALMALISAVYWAFTGLSPWPELIFAQTLVFGSGVGVLTLLSPKRRRP